MTTGDVTPYIGKTLLVGIRYCDHSGEVQQRVQLFGRISRIENCVLYLERSDEKGEFSIPLDEEPLTPGVRGTYTLKTTGQVVRDPDFVSTWTVQAPPPKD